MPSLGADMDSGTLLHWLVRPGDVVHRGEIVAEVDTAKAAIEVECFDDGVMGEILVDEGATVPVGAVLAIIDTVADGTSEVPQEPAGEGEHAALVAPSHASVPSATDETGSAAGAGNLEPRGRAPARTERHDRVRATPLIRQLAQEAGIDLSGIAGTGVGGRILRRDVERAIEDARSRTTAAAEARETPRRQPATAQGGQRFVPATGYARNLARTLGVDITSLTGSGPDGAVRAADVRSAQMAAPSVDAGQPAISATAAQPRRAGGPAQTSRGHGKPEMRQAIAAAMTHSKQTIPHYYLSSTIDLGAAHEWLLTANTAVPVAQRMIMAALHLRAVALAAREVPAVNGHWLSDGFHPSATVDIGVIVSLRGGGILAPTITDADNEPLPAIMSRLRGVVERARSTRLRSSDTAPASITVTNLGELGVDSVIGVIPPPQVAIVGFGAVAEKPCAVAGMLGVRPMVTATLAADHRASDGAVGARFLNTIAELLQHPEQL